MRTVSPATEDEHAQAVEALPRLTHDFEVLVRVGSTGLLGSKLVEGELAGGIAVEDVAGVRNLGTVGVPLELATGGVGITDQSTENHIAAAGAVLGREAASVQTTATGILAVDVDAAGGVF